MSLEEIYARLNPPFNPADVDLPDLEKRVGFSIPFSVIENSKSFLEVVSAIVKWRVE